MNFNPFARTEAIWLLLLHSHPNHPASLQPVTYRPSPNTHALSYDAIDSSVFASQVLFFLVHNILFTF